jgi:D-arginine dehydrogenase
MIGCDILVVGGGMSGMSLAASLCASASVVLIEQEDMPGYHATGRSVAFWEESYGGPAVQPLTTASHALMRDFLSPRGALHIGRAGDEALIAAMLEDFGGSAVTLERRDLTQIRETIPGLRPDWIVGLAEPSCADIDASGLLTHYSGQARRGGVTILTSAELESARRAGTGWQVETRVGPISAGIIVNAAGAWADDVAQRCGVSPLGIAPLRRSVVQLRCPQAPADMPVIMDLRGQFYFKPSGPGRIWLSPHDEVPDQPGDAAPEELDIAIAIDRFEQVVDWTIEAVERRWAGLRSFAPDRVPVYGFDPRMEGFFWFAGQGGFGIQTAPAAALIGAHLLSGSALPPGLAAIDLAPFDPARLPVAH